MKVESILRLHPGVGRDEWTQKSTQPASVQGYARATAHPNLANYHAESHLLGRTRQQENVETCGGRPAQTHARQELIQKSDPKQASGVPWLSVFILNKDSGLEAVAAADMMWVEVELWVRLQDNCRNANNPILMGDYTFL